MGTLRDSGFSSAQAYGSLELRAAASYMTLSQNLDAMDDLNMALPQQGTATEAAERSMDSLSAQWQRCLNIVGAELCSCDGQKDRKSTSLNSRHYCASRMPSSACKQTIHTTPHLLQTYANLQSTI